MTEVSDHVEAESARMPTVEILLSTYNGEHYLGEQIESLLSQDYRHVKITVRDDGSTDGTRAILKQFAASHGIAIHLGENIGVVQSFFTLIGLAAPSSDYVAFCDQDDVWLPTKLSRAVSVLEQRQREGRPLLYCSRVRVTDERLRERGLSPLPRRPPDFANALIENIATGCTSVLNRSARELLVREFPTFALNHDWWAYQVVSAFGEILYDREPTLLYRQHAENATGMGASSLQRLGRKIIRQLRSGNRGAILQQATELRRIFGSSMSPDHRTILDGLLERRSNFLSRLAFCVQCPVHRQGILDDIAFRVLYAAGRV